MPTRIPRMRLLWVGVVAGLGVAAAWTLLGSDGAGVGAPSPRTTARVEPPPPAAAVEMPAPALEPHSEIETRTGPDPERRRLDRPITDLDPETRALLEARLERQRQAERRFQAGVEASQVRARDIDARVRAAFERIDLTPELLDDGFMRGLRIGSVQGGSPLGDAGFQAGDLLVRLDGRALDDPAALPEMLAGAGPELSLCAQRGGTEFCRDLVLR